MLAATLLGASAPSSAQEVLHEDKTYSAPGSLFFGSSVAASGTTIVVGSPGEPDSYSYAGRAYVIDALSGDVLFVLLPFDSAEDDTFGASVAMSDQFVAVGAPLNDALGVDAGCVDVFSPSTGEFLYRVAPHDPVPDQRFGASLAISGTTLLVGAPGASDGSGLPGAVYTFDLVEGLETGKLTPPNGNSGDEFGSSVAADGTTAVIGAPMSGPPFHSGSAFVFDLATQQQILRYTAHDAATADTLGWSVAIAGGVAAAGAPGADQEAGAVYVFSASSGQTIRRTTSPHGIPGGAYGHALAASPSALLVGAPFEAGATGAMYLYEAGTGALFAELRASNAGGFPDELGWAAAIEGGLMLGGAIAHGGPFYPGAVYGYNLGPRVKSMSRSLMAEQGDAPVQFSVDAARALAYQWRHDGEEISDGQLYSGAASATLTVVPTAETEGEYDVLLVNEFGQMSSPPVVLGVRQTCLADADHNGQVDTRDVLAFLAAWRAGCP